MDKEFATDGLKQYPWLKDFCSYLDKEQTDWVDYYLIHAEAVWINKLANWEMESDSSKIEHYYNFNIDEWNHEDGVPTSLKIELFKVFDHLSGGSQDFINKFKEWYTKNYHNTSVQQYNPIGKKLLNECRLAFLEYHSTHKSVTRTPEMEYMFEIANAVSAEHGFDVPIDEDVMCKALEFSHKHGLRIEIIPNKEDVITGKEYGCHYHPEFKEIREKAFETINDHPYYNMVELVEYNDNLFVFELYNSTDKNLAKHTDNRIYIRL